MLITSNTRASILDGSGRPLTNGKLHVCENSDPNSKPLELFREPDFRESAPNPINLNSGGAMPYPIYANKSNAWCHAYNELGALVISYPLNGNTIERGNETEAIGKVVGKELHITGKAVVGDLIAESVSLDEKNIWEKSKDGAKLSTDSIEVGGNITLNKDNFETSEEVDVKIGGNLKVEKETEVNALLKAKNIQLDGMEATDGKKKTYSMANLEEDSPIADVNMTVEKMLEFFPIGSYITCESNSNDMYRINQTLYGRGGKEGFSSGNESIDIHTQRPSGDPVGVYKCCGFTGQKNNHNYFLLRRIK